MTGYREYNKRCGLHIVAGQLFYMIIVLIFFFSACGKNDDKVTQTIEFSEIAPQNLMDSSMQLKAMASSGLPVSFICSNSHIVEIDGSTVKFLTVGSVYITAVQAGNEQYYEAPNITRGLRIHDWDTNKKNQTISFDLPSKWSNEDPPLPLVAASTSGLPVKFTSSDWKGTISNNVLILFHGTYTYNIYINITASQEGDSIYNPAENVVRQIHAIGEGSH
jgi:hypothetical protein